MPAKCIITTCISCHQILLELIESSPLNLSCLRMPMIAVIMYIGIDWDIQKELYCSISYTVSNSTQQQSIHSNGSSIHYYCCINNNLTSFIHHVFIFNSFLLVSCAPHTYICVIEINYHNSCILLLNLSKRVLVKCLLMIRIDSNSNHL